MTKFVTITEYIKDEIRGTQFENHVFAVGGSVRDLQMKRPIKDIDLVIDIENGGVEFAKFCMNRGILTHDVVIYERYGTAMFKFIEFPDDEIECVMTRGEKYPDRNSRNPETVFAGIEEDCIRRDLTINALYYNISTVNCQVKIAYFNSIFLCFFGILRHKKSGEKSSPFFILKYTPLHYARRSSYTRFLYPYISLFCFP